MSAGSDQWDLKVGRASPHPPPVVPPMDEVTPSRFRGDVQWDVSLGAKAEMGPAPSGCVLRAAVKEAMARRLCLPAVLCHLWLCLSRSAALRCHLVPLTQVGPGPGLALDIQKCEKGEVCHQTLLRVRTGPVVASFSSKGCTPPGPQSTGVSQYRQPPEVSLTLYNHVCSTDLCNHQPAASLWNLSAGSEPHGRAFALGPLQCPACAAPHSCPDHSPLVPCPQKSGCYRGLIELVTGNVSLPLALGGCGSWTNCSLLEGFWTPGPMALREACENGTETRRWGGRTARGGVGGPDPPRAWPGRLAWLLALWGMLPDPAPSPWDLGP